MEHVATAPLPPLVPAHKIGLVMKCIARVIADSERTGDIMIAEEISGQRRLVHLLRRGALDTPEGRELLRDRPSFADVDFAALAELPEDTLGGALAAFHRDNKLTPDLYLTPASHTEDPDAAFLMQRLRHSHDIWHVLTGLGTQGHEEILLHSWSLAQTGLPASVALMIFGSIKHMLLEGRFETFAFGMARAFRAGRAADSVLSVYWERYWETPLAEVRARHGIVPLS